MQVRSGVFVSCWMVVILAAGCGDDDATAIDGGRIDAGGVDASTDAGPPELGDPWVPVAVGDPVSATIGPEGGTITSADGLLRLDFPPGALTAETAIGIQGIEWPEGLGWSLTPNRLDLAVPAIATITQPDGDPVVTVEGRETLVAMPLAKVFHAPPRDSAEAPPPVELVWREPDGEVDYVVPLEHFSFVMVSVWADVRTTRRMTLWDGDVGQIACMQAVGPIRRERFLLVCPFVLDAAGEPLMYLSSPFEAERAVSSLIVFPSPPIELIGRERSRRITAMGMEYDALIQDLRCVAHGEVTLEVDFNFRTRALDSIDVPEGCHVWEPAGPYTTRVPVTCGEAPTDGGVGTDGAVGMDGGVVSMDDGGGGEAGLFDDAALDAGPRPNGAACMAGAECRSRFCVDGVCCNERCDGVCKACVASLSISPDGTCAALQNDTDPGDADCPGTQTCQITDPVPPETAYCRAHLGDPCTDDAWHTDCPGPFFCRQGVCCDLNCGVPMYRCHSCAAATRGYGTDGMCQPIAMGLDPFMECPGTRVCNGAGVCGP